MDKDAIYRIEPVPEGFEAVWGIVNTQKPAEYIDWITGELKPEQVVQIFCTDSDKAAQAEPSD